MIEGDIEEARGPTGPVEMSALGRTPTGLQMSLRFEPITLVFKDLRYSVAPPAAHKPDAKAKPRAKASNQTQPTELQVISPSTPAAASQERLELLKVYSWLGTSCFQTCPHGCSKHMLKISCFTGLLLHVSLWPTNSVDWASFNPSTTFKLLLLMLTRFSHHLCYHMYNIIPCSLHSVCICDISRLMTCANHQCAVFIFDILRLTCNQAILSSV